MDNSTMHTALAQFVLSVLASVIAWLITLKATDSLKRKSRKSWVTHVALLILILPVSYILLLASTRLVHTEIEQKFKNEASREAIHPNQQPPRKPNLSPEELFLKRFLTPPNNPSERTKQWVVAIKGESGHDPEVIHGAIVKAVTERQ